MENLVCTAGLLDQQARAPCWQAGRLLTGWAAGPSSTRSAAAVAVACTSRALQSSRHCTRRASSSALSSSAPWALAWGPTQPPAAVGGGGTSLCCLALLGAGGLCCFWSTCGCDDAAPAVLGRPRADRLPGRLPSLAACCWAGCAARAGLGSPEAAATPGRPACCGRGVLRGDQPVTERSLR